MKLGEQASRELQAKLVELENDKQRIDAEIAAIRLLIGGARKQSRKARPTLISRESGKSVKPLPESHPLLVAARQVTGGFRSALRGVLEDGPKSPGEVIGALRSSGYPVTGKTPLDTRVYNELGRMKRDGLAARDGQGRYALTA